MVNFYDFEEIEDIEEENILESVDLQQIYFINEISSENKYALIKSIIDKRTQRFNVNIPILIITVSDTLREESGKIAEELMQIQPNLNVVERITITSTDFEKTLHNYLSNSNIRCIITIGGTGISPTDNVIEVVKKYLEKELPGFGELFRYLTHQEFGNKKHISGIAIPSIDTRTTAGTIGKKIVFALPGSPGSVKLAISEIVVHSLHTLVGQLDKDIGE